MAIQQSRRNARESRTTKEELDPEKTWLLNDFLSKGECAALISRSEGLRYEGTVDGVVAEGIRNNERVLIDDQPLADELFCRAAHCLPQVVEQRPLVRFNEHWRFYRYRSGQTFHLHRDGSYMSLDTYAKSEVTFLIYLNDDMVGGETRFFMDMDQVSQRCPCLTVKPRIGAALVFLHIHLARRSCGAEWREMRPTYRCHVSALEWIGVLSL